MADNNNKNNEAKVSDQVDIGIKQTSNNKVDIRLGENTLTFDTPSGVFEIKGTQTKHPDFDKMVVKSTDQAIKSQQELIQSGCMSASDLQLGVMYYAFGVNIQSNTWKTLASLHERVKQRGTSFSFGITGNLGIGFSFQSLTATREQDFKTLAGVFYADGYLYIPVPMTLNNPAAESNLQTVASIFETYLASTLRNGSIKLTCGSFDTFVQANSEMVKDKPKNFPTESLGLFHYTNSILKTQPNLLVQTFKDLKVDPKYADDCTPLIPELALKIDDPQIGLQLVRKAFETEPKKVQLKISLVLNNFIHSLKVEFKRSNQ